MYEEVVEEFLTRERALDWLKRERKERPDMKFWGPVWDNGYYKVTGRAFKKERSK
jgi:hypothetical protein